MGLRLADIIQAKQIIRRSLTRNQVSSAANVPQGHLAVYVGESKKRFVVPVSFLKHSLFQELLSRAEEEFGFDHQTGGLRIPCEEDIFLTLTSQLRSPSSECPSMKKNLIIRGKQILCPGH